MGESEAIAATETPATASSIAVQLRDLGVIEGMTVMVHTSLSKLGFVVGGAHTVVVALLDVVGPTGTLMMPTHSGALSDPAGWQNPPVPESWWQTLRDEMPAFDTALTPTRQMGAVAECFRHVRGVKRSNHPTVSAAAIGPNAAALLDNHDLHDHLGDSSPQGALYSLDGHVLLLGVDHGNNTSLHVSEARWGPKRTVDGAPVMVDGQREWVQVNQLEDDDEDFSRIGEAFAATGNEQRGTVGIGTARLCRSRDIVDFGLEWMRANRTRND